MAAGLVMLVLPGPGIVVVVLGFAVLATEFVWAEVALDKAKAGATSAGQAGQARASYRPPLGGSDPAGAAAAVDLDALAGEVAGRSETRYRTMSAMSSGRHTRPKGLPVEHVDVPRRTPHQPPAHLGAHQAGGDDVDVHPVSRSSSASVKASASIAALADVVGGTERRCTPGWRPRR